ncbi:MAG: hypothetical protein KAV82_04195 [Phycisphaerae bacterium]|nr:hypothetical protein [Phycisphaerae bacterium]
MRKTTVLIPLFAVVALGCSEGARDRLTRFFFEVPGQTETAADNGEKPASARQTAADQPEPQYASVHQPYAEHQCSACHDVGQRMRVVDDLASACGTCHKRYFGEEAAHGPVADGDCSECHMSHRSRYAHLLKSTVRDSCTGDCHDPDDLSDVDAHGGPDADNCTTCHDPHFGSSPYLRAGEG